MVKSIHKTLLLIIIVLFIVSMVSCNALGSIPTPTVASTSTATISPTETHIPKPTITFTPEPSPTTSIPPVPTSSLANQSVLSLANECRTVIDGLYKLKKDLGLPEHFTEENPFRLDSEFNPNSYFEVFTHLELTPGYKLDYVYFNDHLGGLPLIYARKLDSAPFLSYAEFLNSFGEEITYEQSFGTLSHQFDYLEHIQVDKTPESYFEFLAIAMLGDQFYLWWHSLYSDGKILCNSNDLQYIYTDLNNFGLEFPPEMKDRIDLIDFTPAYLVEENSVTVRLVTFSKWEGFNEFVYEMNKDNPLDMYDVKFTPLIEYDCGINF